MQVNARAAAFALTPSTVQAPNTSVQEHRHLLKAASERQPAIVLPVIVNSPRDGGCAPTGPDGEHPSEVAALDVGERSVVDAIA